MRFELQGTKRKGARTFWQMFSVMFWKTRSPSYEGVALDYPCPPHGDRRSRQFPTDLAEMDSTAATLGAPATLDFAADLDGVARTLRTSLSALLVSLGLDPGDSQALVRRWGINRQLSWKIAKVVQSHDSFVALQHLPGNEALATVLTKARDAGASAGSIEAVRVAAQDVDRLIDSHCGDRTSFDIMGSALSTAEQGLQQQEVLRRQFYQGASSIWGAQTKVNLVSWFVAPSASGDPHTADVASIKAWLGFRRLRANLSWVISRHMSRNDDGAYLKLPEPEALDPTSSWTVPLMRSFCSETQPSISVKEDADRLMVSLAPGPVGNAGQVSCVFGKLHRNLQHVRNAQNHHFRFFCELNIPAEVTLFDVYIHRSMAYAIPPVAMLSSLIEPREPEAEHNQLPLAEPLLALGAPSPAPLTLEVPRYDEMLGMVFARAGWNAKDFVGFRIRLAYAPIPALLSMTYELP